MDQDKLYRACKVLIATPEWDVFEKHIKEIIAIHKESSVHYTIKDKEIDSKRQAWISEGLLEAIEEPRRVIVWKENNPMNMAKKLCRQCGQFLREMVNH